jgi:hypothetical protein
LLKNAKQKGVEHLYWAGTMYTFVTMCTKVQGVPRITQWVLGNSFKTLQEDSTNRWENGWFLVRSSGGVGHFILIRTPTLCGVELEKDSVFILVSKLVAVQGIHNFICR